MLITEHLGVEERAALDARLDRPDPGRRAAVVAQMGGEVRSRRR